MYIGDQLCGLVWNKQWRPVNILLAIVSTDFQLWTWFCNLTNTIQKALFSILFTSVMTQRAGCSSRFNKREVFPLKKGRIFWKVAGGGEHFRYKNYVQLGNSKDPYQFTLICLNLSWFTPIFYDLPSFFELSGLSILCCMHSLQSNKPSQCSWKTSSPFHGNATPMWKREKTHMEKKQALAQPTQGQYKENSILLTHIFKKTFSIYIFNNILC